MNVAHIGKVPRINPVQFAPDHPMVDERNEPTSLDDGPGCTEIVMSDWEERQPPLTLLGAFGHYIDERARPRGSHVGRVIGMARNFCAVWGIDRNPATIKRKDELHYIERRLATGVSPNTVRREFGIGRAAFRHNVKFERIERAPIMEAPSCACAKRRPMTEDEYRRLMRSPMPRRLRLFNIIAYWTGHRERAIETLPWSRVFFETRTIDFNEPGARITNKRRTDGYPMPEELYRRLLAAKEYADKFMPDDPYVIGMGPSGRPTSIGHLQKRALKAIGITEKGLRCHTLRKTFVTERIKAGANPEKVAMLISDRPETMRKHYLVMKTEDLRSTAERAA